MILSPRLECFANTATRHCLKRSRLFTLAMSLGSCSRHTLFSCMSINAAFFRKQKIQVPRLPARFLVPLREITFVWLICSSSLFIEKFCFTLAQLISRPLCERSTLTMHKLQSVSAFLSWKAWSDGILAPSLFCCVEVSLLLFLLCWACAWQPPMISVPLLSNHRCVP